ncbi:MAG: phosphate acyltransferase PlsX [Candidatus Gallimonas sp.]
MLKIVVDAMGGDNAPAEIIKGAVQALSDREDFSIILTGDRSAIETELGRLRYDASRVEIVHCTEVVTNDEAPTTAVRTKKDSSLVVGMKRLKEDPEVGGFVSAGSTGAVLTGGIMLVGRIKGVMRPALCPGIPNVRGTRTLLCDCGANAECKPAYLAQFGVMATAYARAAFGIEKPRVGLLTNGTEEHKGDPLHQEAHRLLKETQGIDFVGNIEGRDVMYGDVDIAVADGFSGNIALKAVEGCGKTVSAVLKREFKRNFFSKLSYLCAKKQINRLRDMLDYAKLGGSVFLGLKKVVVKCHGSSKANSVRPSVVQAVDAYRNRLVETIEELLLNTPTGEANE